MRALELGRTLPGDMPWFSTQRIGFLMGAVVPVVPFGFAWLPTQSPASSPTSGSAAAIVERLRDLSGRHIVVCVGANGQGRSEQAVSPRPRRSPVEDDAYDVVSARG